MDIAPQHFEEGAALAQRIVQSHGEAVTYSHMQWLSRECAKLMMREFACTAREEAIARKERNMRQRNFKRFEREESFSVDKNNDAPDQTTRSTSA